MKKKIALKKMIVLFCISLATSTAGYAAEITSVGSGDWLAASTWVGGVVPTSSDNVTIGVGQTVSYFVDFSKNKAVELCNNMDVEGTLQMSNSLQQTFTANIYGTVVCNGTIELGRTGGAVSGVTLSFKGTSASLSGIGSATLRTIQMATSVPATCIITIPTITCLSGMNLTSDGSNITVSAGTTISGLKSLSPAGPKGQGPAIGTSMDIYGTVSCDTIYLCNGSDPLVNSAKSRINIKNGGILNVFVAATPVRGAGSVIGTIGGTGTNFSVESGGKFNFTAPATDPMLCTSFSNTPYDSNLFVGYYAGSIINGTVKSSTITGGVIPTGINAPKIDTQGVYYNSTNNNLVLSKNFTNIKIYNAKGQIIVNQKNPESRVAVPTSFKGICIVTMTNEIGKSFSFKINVK